MSSAGYVVFVRKDGKTTSPFDLIAGEEYTLGSSRDCDIRFKFAHPLLQDVHALLHVDDHGFATLTNKYTEQTIKVNDKPLLKARVLKDQDKFDILGKVFHYFNADLKDVTVAEKKLSQQSIKHSIKQRKSIHPILTSQKTSPQRKHRKIPSFVTPTRGKISPKCKTESKVSKTVVPPRNAKKRRLSLGTFKTNIRTSPPILTEKLNPSNSLAITETDELVHSSNSDLLNRTPRTKRTSKANVAVSPLPVPTLRREFSSITLPKVLEKSEQSLNSMNSNIDASQCSFAIEAPTEGSPFEIKDCLTLTGNSSGRKRISLSASTKSYRTNSIVPARRRRTINIVEEKDVSPQLKGRVLKLQPRRSIRSRNLKLNAFNIGKDSPSLSINKLPRKSVKGNLESRRSQRISNIQEPRASESLNDDDINLESINEQKDVKMNESLNKSIKNSSFTDREKPQNNHSSVCNLERDSQSAILSKDISLNNDYADHVKVNQTEQSTNLLEDPHSTDHNLRKSSRRSLSTSNLKNESNNHDNNDVSNSIDNENDVKSPSTAKKIKEVSLISNSPILARKSLRFNTSEIEQLNTPKINREGNNSPNKIEKLKESLVESSFEKQVTYEMSTRKSLRRSTSLNNSQEILSSSTRKSVRQSHSVKDTSSNSIFTLETRKSVSDQLTEIVTNTSFHEKSVMETSYMSTENYLRHSRILANEDSKKEAEKLLDVSNASPIPRRESLVLPAFEEHTSLRSNSNSIKCNKTDESQSPVQYNSSSSEYLSSLVQSGESAESVEDMFNDKGELPNSGGSQRENDLSDYFTSIRKSLRENIIEPHIEKKSPKTALDSVNVSTRSTKKSMNDISSDGDNCTVVNQNLTSEESPRRYTRESMKDVSNSGQDSPIANISLKKSPKSETINISTRSTRKSMKDDLSYGDNSQVDNTSPISKGSPRRSTRKSMKNVSNDGQDSPIANISLTLKHSPKSESINISTRSTRKSMRDDSNYRDSSQVANMGPTSKESPRRSTRKSTKDVSNDGQDSPIANISSTLKTSPKGESFNKFTRSTRKSMKDDSSYGDNSQVVNTSPSSKGSPRRSTKKSMKNVSNDGQDSPIANISLTLKHSPKSESINTSNRSTRKSMRDDSNYRDSSQVVNMSPISKESTKPSTRKSMTDFSNDRDDSMVIIVSPTSKDLQRQRKSIKDVSMYEEDSLLTNKNSYIDESQKGEVESTNMSTRSTRKSIKDLSNDGEDFVVAKRSPAIKESPISTIDLINTSTRSARKSMKDVSNYGDDSMLVNVTSTFKESPQSTVESVNVSTRSTRKSTKDISKYDFLNQSETKRNSKLINETLETSPLKTLKRDSTIIDSQEETLNMHKSLSKTKDRSYVGVSIFDESTEVLPSPVQHISSRRSLRSFSNTGLRSSNNDENALVTNHDDNSVISISSQSFSSFKKNEINNDTEREIDVVSLSFMPNVKNNTRLSRTSIKKERATSVSMTPIAKASLFDDVLCTSTPFCKPSTSKENQPMLDSNKSELELSSNNANVISISSESTLNNTSGATENRRTSRRKKSISHEDSCISCRHSMGSVSASVKEKSSNSVKSSKTPVQQRASRSLNFSKTPRRSFALEDETPKSALKSKRLSSKTNTSVYQPLTEDITPVTPEKLMISELNEEAFKTPINTPGLFESIKENVIRSRKRRRETNESFIKDAKRAKTNTPTKSESTRKGKTQKSPKNDLTKVPNLKPLMSPKVQKTPKNDLTDVTGVKRIFEKNSPLNDLRDIPSVKDLESHTPKNDLTDVFGVKRIFQKNSPGNDLRNIPNLRNLVESKKNTPKNDLRNIPNLQKFVSPRSQRSPRNNLANVSGVANIFNVSGVEVLYQGNSDIENSGDVFSKLTGQKPLRSYKGKSLSPFKGALQNLNLRKTMGDLPVSSPRVQEWVNEQTNMIYKEREANKSLISKISDKPQLIKRGRSVSPIKTISDVNNRRKSYGGVEKSLQNSSRRKSEPPHLIPLKHSRARTKAKSVTPDKSSQVEDIGSAKQKKLSPKGRSSQGSNEVSPKKTKLDYEKTPNNIEESHGIGIVKGNLSKSITPKVNPPKSVRFKSDEDVSAPIETPPKKTSKTRKQKRVYESPVLDEKLIDPSGKSDEKSPPTKKTRKTIKKNTKSDNLLLVEDVNTPMKKERKTSKKEAKPVNEELTQLPGENQSTKAVTEDTLFVDIEQLVVSVTTESTEPPVKRNTRTRRNALNDDVKQSPAVSEEGKLSAQNMKHSTPIIQTPIKKGRKITKKATELEVTEPIQISEDDQITENASIVKVNEKPVLKRNTRTRKNKLNDEAQQSPAMKITEIEMSPIRKRDKRKNAITTDDSSNAKKSNRTKTVSSSSDAENDETEVPTRIGRSTRQHPDTVTNEDKQTQGSKSGMPNKRGGRSGKKTQDADITEESQFDKTNEIHEYVPTTRRGRVGRKTKNVDSITQSAEESKETEINDSSSEAEEPTISSKKANKLTKKSETKKIESLEVVQTTRTRSGRKNNLDVQNNENENKGRRNLRNHTDEADSKQDTADVINARSPAKRGGKRGKKTDDAPEEAPSVEIDEHTNKEEAKTKRGRKAEDDENESSSIKDKRKKSSTRGKRTVKQIDNSEEQEAEEDEPTGTKRSTRNRRVKGDGDEPAEKASKTRSRSTKRTEKNDESEIKEPVTRRGRKRNDNQSVEKTVSEINTESTSTRSLRKRK